MDNLMRTGCAGDADLLGLDAVQRSGHVAPYGSDGFFTCQNPAHMWIEAKRKGEMAPTVGIEPTTN